MEQVFTTLEAVVVHLKQIKQIAETMMILLIMEEHKVAEEKVVLMLIVMMDSVMQLPILVAEAAEDHFLLLHQEVETAEAEVLVL
tara:strand:+ start:375 stop:629 length:255 start_codon:yes stop_codon:yes gene_type:complete